MEEQVYQTKALSSMYFIALVCPQPVDKEVRKLKLWMRDYFGCRVALKSPAHITLLPPFWMPVEREKELVNHALDFTSDLLPVEIALENFDHFGNRVIFINVIPTPDLKILKEEVEDHFLMKLDEIIKKDTRPFHPHVTIANRDLKPGDFKTAWQHFSRKQFEARFSIDTISVLKLVDGKWNVIE